MPIIATELKTGKAILQNWEKKKKKSYTFLKAKTVIALDQNI